MEAIKKKKNFIVLIVGILLVLFIYSKYDMFKEINLGDLYAYHASSFESLEFEFTGHDT